MKKYNIELTRTINSEVEAENEEEAKKIALEGEGNELIDGTEVEEVKEMFQCKKCKSESYTAKYGTRGVINECMTCGHEELLNNSLKYKIN